MLVIQDFFFVSPSFDPNKNTNNDVRRYFIEDGGFVFCVYGNENTYINKRIPVLYII